MSEASQSTGAGRVILWLTVIGTVAAVISAWTGIFPNRGEPGFVQSPTVSTLSESVLSSPDARVVRVKGFMPTGAKPGDERFLALTKGTFWQLPRLSVLWRSGSAKEIHETPLYQFSASTSVGEFDIDDGRGLFLAAIHGEYPAKGEPKDSIFLLDYSQRFAGSYGVRCTTSIEPELSAENAGVPAFSDKVHSVTVDGAALTIGLLTPCWWVSIGSAVFELPANGTLAIATATKEAVPFSGVSQRDETERRLESRNLRYEYSRKDIVTGTVLKYDAKLRSIQSERFRIVYADPKSVSDTVAMAQKNGFIDIQFTTYQGTDLASCTKATEAAQRDAYQTSFYCLAMDPKPEAGVISIIRRSVEGVDLKSVPLHELRNRTDSLRAQGYAASSATEFDKCDRCYLLTARSVFVDLGVTVSRTYQLQPAGVFAAKKENAVSEPAPAAPGQPR